MLGAKPVLPEEAEKEAQKAQEGHDGPAYGSEVKEEDHDQDAEDYLNKVEEKIFLHYCQ